MIISLLPIIYVVQRPKMTLLVTLGTRTQISTRHMQFHPITDHYVLLSVGGIPPGLGVGDVWVGAKGRTERL